MPMPKKPTPEKYCEACGTQLMRLPEKDGDMESLLHFSRRKFCSRACMADGFRGRWRPNVLPHQGRYRARTLGPKGSCGDCGRQGRIDRHHIDENPLNNSPENLADLCRSCHSKRHRLVRFCSAVDCLRVHRRNGLCDMHDQRRKAGRQVEIRQIHISTSSSEMPLRQTRQNGSPPAFGVSTNMLD